VNPVQYLYFFSNIENKNKLYKYSNKRNDSVELVDISKYSFLCVKTYLVLVLRFYIFFYRKLLREFLFKLKKDILT